MLPVVLPPLHELLCVVPLRSGILLSPRLCLKTHFTIPSNLASIILKAQSRRHSLRVAR